MKKFVSGVVVGTLLMASASVFADDGLEQISAYLRPALPIKLDGQKLELKNAPIIYDGSTYLPLREMAGVFGKEIYWNEAEQTVELGARSGGPKPNPTPTPTATATPSATPAPTATPKPGGTPTFEYLPHSALKADGNIYLPITAGAEKYQLTIEWDEKTKSAKFTDVGMTLYVKEYSSGADVFSYQGTIYLKESLIADMASIVKQTFQSEYPPFRSMFRIGEMTYVTTSEAQVKAEYTGTLANSDFKIQWLMAKNKENYMKQLAKDVQGSIPTRTLTMTFYYGTITLGWVTVEPNGTTKSSLVADPL